MAEFLKDHRDQLPRPTLPEKSALRDDTVGFHYDDEYDILTLHLHLDLADRALTTLELPGFGWSRIDALTGMVVAVEMADFEASVVPASPEWKRVWPQVKPLILEGQFKNHSGELAQDLLDLVPA